MQGEAWRVVTRLSLSQKVLVWIRRGRMEACRVTGGPLF